MQLNRENVDYIQSACNPLAVARQFHEWCQQVKDETNSFDAIKQNKLLLATLGKLCSLFNLDHDGSQAYAYLTEETQNNG